MAHVYRTSKPKPPPGYSENQGNRKTLENIIARKAIEALQAGETSFMCRDELYVLCNGKFIAWHKVDPTKVGII